MFMTTDLGFGKSFSLQINTRDCHKFWKEVSHLPNWFAMYQLFSG